MPPTRASGLVRQAVRFSTNCHTDCASNTENRHAVSRILAGTKQHIPGSSCNILPGSAPALRGVILYPFSPLPLPLTHPITLTPNMERTRMRQHLLHIPAQTLPFSAHFAAKWARTPEQDFRLGNLVPEVVTSLGNRLEWVSRVRKKGLGLLQGP